MTYYAIQYITCMRMNFLDIINSPYLTVKVTFIKQCGFWMCMKNGHYTFLQTVKWYKHYVLHLKSAYWNQCRVSFIQCYKYVHVHPCNRNQKFKTDSAWLYQPLEWPCSIKLTSISETCILTLSSHPFGVPTVSLLLLSFCLLIWPASPTHQTSKTSYL